MSDTLVTVAMPVYNGMPYLPAAVESILNQTYKDFRFLIINDGSIDGSAEYLDGISDPRLDVIHQENRGSGIAAQRSLELCQTEFYARMDADDISYPERLAIQVEYLRKHPEVSLLGGQIDFLIDDGLFVRAPALPLEHDKIVRNLLKKKPVVCQPSMMIRKDAAIAAGGYRIPNAGQDFDLFLRLAEVGKLANTSLKLLSYRLHINSLSNRRRWEVNRGVAYAIRCAECRRAGRPEPELSEFSDEWDRRGYISKVREMRDLYAKSKYRNGIISFARGRRARAALCFAQAAALGPRRAFEMVLTRLIKQANR